MKSRQSSGIHTFILEEIAHPRPARKHELGHILNDLGLLLRRKSREPLGQTLIEKICR